MDEDVSKLINQISISEMVNKIQIQNKLINPTMEISEKLAKAMEQMNSVSRLAASEENQDLLSRLSKTFPQSNLAIDSALAGIVRSLAESNSLSSSVFESIKFNKTIIDAFEATHLGLKPRTQFILPESFISKNQIGNLSSVISKATEVFKQYEQFGELESFKAISRLKNFPFEDILLTDFTQFPAIDNSNDETIFEMDAEISNELSSAESFYDLSTKSQSSLLNLYQNYYSPTLFS